MRAFLLVFPVLVAVMETGAAVVYLWAGDWLRGVMWSGYAAAAWVLVWL